MEIIKKIVDRLREPWTITFPIIDIALDKRFSIGIAVSTYDVSYTVRDRREMIADGRSKGAFTPLVNHRLWARGGQLFILGPR